MAGGAPTRVSGVWVQQQLLSGRGVSSWVSVAIGNHLLGLQADKMTVWEAGTADSISKNQKAEPGFLGLNPNSPMDKLYVLGEVT